MKSYTNNQTEVILTGENIGEVLGDLVIKYPHIKVHIMDKKGDLRRYVNLYINKVNIKELNGLKTIITEGDDVILLPSISGG